MILIPHEEYGNCPQANICNKTTQKKGGGGKKITEALGQGFDPAAEPGLGLALSSNYTAFPLFACLYANPFYL